MDQEKKDHSAYVDFHLHSEWLLGEHGAAPHPTSLLDQQEAFQATECKNCLFPLVQ